MYCVYEWGNLHVTKTIYTASVISIDTLTQWISVDDEMDISIKDIIAVNPSSPRVQPRGQDWLIE